MADIYLNDSELLQRLKQGDDEAFALLYKKYAESLTFYAASRLQSLEEARDLIHDLFVHFWEERENICIKVSLRAYLFTSIRYRIIDHYRKNKTQQTYQEKLAKISEVQISAEDLISAKEMEENLRVAIGELSPRVQEVFHLSRFQYLSISEIAKKLGTSERTIKNQLSTAIIHLRIKFLKLYFLVWWLPETYLGNFFINSTTSF